MRHIHFIAGLFLIGVLLCSCGSESAENGVQSLEEMFDEIVTIAESVSCDDPAEWTFTAYGSKACGGPLGYIAYSTTIDVDQFLQLVEAHRVAQKEYNEANGIISDCALAQPPTGVTCKDGVSSFN